MDINIKSCSFCPFSFLDFGHEHIPELFCGQTGNTIVDPELLCGQTGDTVVDTPPHNCPLKTDKITIQLAKG